MENNNCIIFGASGQDGYYLNELLQKQGINVIKISRKIGDLIGNIADYKFVEQVIKEYQPKFVFHFAANSTTHHRALFENHKSISTGTFNVLESVRLHCPTAKVFLSGSAMQFKNEGVPIHEQTPFEASSPYSVARIQSVYAARYYRNKFGLRVYVGYFFNHDSPLRTEQHVNQKIAQAAKRIAAGSDTKLTLGNIDVQKEFNYAGDVVEAVWKLVSQDIVFEAIIGSGKAYKILDWLEYCFTTMNLNWKEYVVLEQSYIPEYQILVSNPQLIISLGWEPKVDFYQLANKMMYE